MVSEIITGLGTFKAMLDAAKALKDISDGAVRNGVVIELQEKILTAMEAQTTLSNRVSELEAEVIGMKNWEAEKERYELSEISPGIFAYAVKPSMQAAEPVHCLCTNCFHLGKKSILNAVQDNFVIHMICPSCRVKVLVDVTNQNFPLKNVKEPSLSFA